MKIQKYAHEMHARLENAPNAADDNYLGMRKISVTDPVCTCTLVENIQVVANSLYYHNP